MDKRVSDFLDTAMAREDDVSAEIEPSSRALLSLDDSHLANPAF